MAVGRAGLVAAVPLGCGFVGAMGAGWLSDRLLPALGAVRARKVPLAAFLFGAAACSGAAAVVGATGWALPLICAAVFCGNAAATCSWALATAVAPAAQVATLEAVQNVGGSVGGALAPAVTGLLVQHTGSFAAALLVGAGAAAVSGLAVLLGVAPGAAGAEKRACPS